MGKHELLEMTRSLIDHSKAGTMAQADTVMAIPATDYTDEKLFDTEKKKIFRRLPLMVAPSCELPEPGDYKAMDIVGVPLLLTRQKDGAVRAFLNMCTHRGNPLVEDTGNAPRFTCNYHGWTFKNDGALMGVASPEDFGAIDRPAFCLKEFPSLEKAGLIWVTLDPTSALSIETFLCGYDDLLSHFHFENWHLFESRVLSGPNWKTAYDGYLDFYHLPVLHKNSFGADFFNRANYFAWGPHQRVATPSSKVQGPDDQEPVDLATLDEAEWPDDAIMTGVWTIFPHISIASFYGGGVRGAMISQLFPGEGVGDSFTTQFYVMEKKPNDPDVIQGAHEQFEFLKHVVRDEDYATGKRQHEALQSGLMDQVWFGRNEGGGQVFHGWVKKLLNTPDDGLEALFGAERPAAH